MTTSDFIHTLRNNTGKSLYFELPDGDVLGGDLHITEIKHQQVDSVDCGANSHSFEETVIQLWINEDSGKNADWTTQKAISIIDKVGMVRPYVEESEVFIEFGDSGHPTIRYSVDHLQNKEDQLIIKMKVKPTACKPRLNLIPAVACC